MILNSDSLIGRTVYDREGSKLGSVGQIYVDDRTSEPTFVTVNMGLFGTNETFIPVAGATERSTDELTVPYTKDFIKDAPNVDPDGHLDDAEQDRLLQHYQTGADAGAGSAGGIGDGYTGETGRVAGSDPHLEEDTAQRSAGTDAAYDDPATRGDAGEGMVRREEELHVGTERVETGRVRLRKHVVTEQQTVSVPVEREEVEVIREPVERGRTGGDLADDVQEVTLTEDRPVVQKDVVEKERVRLDRQAHTDQEQVSTDVSHEEIEVERTGEQTGYPDSRG